MLKTIIILGSLFLMVSCNQASNAMTQGKPGTQQKNTPEDMKLPPRASFSQVTRGGKLYQANCATCHGTQGEGEPNWRQTRADGVNPAPPLNGTGHAWHHPKKILIYTIKNGTPGGKSRMQPWKEKLNHQEIEDIIAWFISRWPKEIYAAWYKRNKGM
ncbi:MAG: cytochrome c [Gammaproteobacteria bacterium]|nr:cytochrome c [Gammaproteobacteria bacterium]